MLQSSVLVSQWTKVLENVQFYYAGFTDLPVTYSNIYQLEGVNQFYITNMLGSGADLYFKIDGTFNADNPLIAPVNWFLRKERVLPYMTIRLISKTIS